MKVYGHTGRPWQTEFFQLAGFMLGCKLRACDGEPDRCGVLLGEMDYGAEMHLVLKEAGMLRRQRLARCAAGLLNTQRLRDRRALAPHDTDPA